MRSLDVSEYNKVTFNYKIKGRTNKDVSDKIWPDGGRDKLRPDTMWADERYTEIT